MPPPLHSPTGVRRIEWRTTALWDQITKGMSASIGILGEPKPVRALRSAKACFPSSRIPTAGVRTRISQVYRCPSWKKGLRLAPNRRTLGAAMKAHRSLFQLPIIQPNRLPPASNHIPMFGSLGHPDR